MITVVLKVMKMSIFLEILYEFYVRGAVEREIFMHDTNRSSSVKSRALFKIV